MQNNFQYWGFSFKAFKNSHGQILHQGTSKLGDRLVMTGLHEMLFKQRNIISVDMDYQDENNNPNFFYDYNPYVVRDSESRSKVTQMIYPQIIKDKSSHVNYLRNLPSFTSISDHMCSYFGLECTIRSPKLYKYQNNKIIPNQIVICSQGDLKGIANGEIYPRVLPKHVIEHIKNKYDNFNLIQIGSKDDIDLGIVDKRGINIWEAVKIISESSMMIAPNTGPLWIAMSYGIPIKCLLSQYSKESLKYFIPMNSQDHHSIFCDWHFDFYNCFEESVGVTETYKKI